ncbi:phage baseplate protein [Tenebrionicola larvae]|uniref:phage baseplate protein n=1 Tax=Tenebrionicola larvae TaxID=2815733 RepID=UPI002011C3E0
MADFDNTELAFLQDLPAHASPKGSDLLLVNTDGMDKSLTLSKLAEFSGIIDTLYPVGIVTWFAQNKNPNTLFPGTTWKYIGENKTIRLAAANGADVMMTGGADSVRLAVGNLPAHGHTFSANTSSFDYGTKATNSTALTPTQLVVLLPQQARIRTP